MRPAITPVSLLLAVLASAAAQAQVTTRVTQRPDGAQASHSCDDPTISGDGRIVAFTTESSLFDASDTNGFKDIYVFDRVAGTYELVSRTKSGGLGNGDSIEAHLSTDGRYVLFTSFAGNLVSSDLNNRYDYFVRDRVAATTKRVNLRDNGAEITDWCYYPTISGNGQFVSFVTAAANVVANDWNGRNDVFVRDLVAKTTVRISVDDAGNELPSGGSSATLSDDGLFASLELGDAAEPGDLNGEYDVYLRDMAAGTMTRISLDASGGSPDDYCLGSINGDATLLFFSSAATDLVPGVGNGVDPQYFTRDLATGLIECVTPSPYPTPVNTNHFARSQDGRFVSFQAWDANLVADDTNNSLDHFVYDSRRGLMRRVSVGTDGSQGNLGGFGATGRQLSDDGLVYVFFSDSTDLDDDDTNGESDVFVHELSPAVAAWSTYGNGLAGTLGIPTVTPLSDPVLGTTLDVAISNSAGIDTFALIASGVATADLPLLGGRLLVDALLWLPLSLPAAGATVSVELPYEHALAGLAFYSQVLEVDAGAVRRVAFTAGLELDLGF